MSLSIAGINIAEAIINHEYQLLRTQKILDWIINNNTGVRGPDMTVLQRLDTETIQEIQKKYPEAGIGRK